MKYFLDFFPQVYGISFEPGSKLLVLGMVIQPLIGNPYNGYINPYYWVDDHPLLYRNNGSLDPSTFNYLLLSINMRYPKNPWDVMGCQVATCFEALKSGVS